MLLLNGKEMNINNYTNIVFCESYILGWLLNEKKLLLFLEVLLSKDHPEFVEYNNKTEFGCYKLSVMSFNNVQYIKGLPFNALIPVWNSELKEFIDETEINKLIKNEEIYIVSSDNFELTVKCSDVKISIIKDYSEIAFDEFL